MKLMITGVAGFVGTNAAERLREKYEIIGVDKRAPRERFDGITYERSDILDYQDIKKIIWWHEPDVILHLAAVARVEPSLTDPIGCFRTNVAGTINLLEIAKKVGVGKFVYASSEAIYGKSDRYPTREIDHFRPATAYAASKIAADVMVQNCHGLNTCVLRSGMGIGERCNPAEQVAPKFILKAINDKPLLFPKGDVAHPTRDFNYIGNFIDGIELVIEHDATGVYNIGSGTETSMLDFAQKVIEIVGGGRIEFTDSFKYREAEAGMRTWLDISKARDELGYYPKIGLEEAIRISKDWLLTHSDYWR